MSEQNTSRRAVLTGAAGVAVAGALAAAPMQSVTAAASGALVDTPIQRLWRQYVALLAECERLSREDDLAFDRLVTAMPPIPDELRTNFFHAHVNGLKDYVRVGNYGRGDVEWIAADGWRQRIEQPLCPAEEGPIAEHMMVTHDRARAREVLPIAERYEAACAAARVESGYAATSAACDAAIERKCDFENEIMSTPAEGISDLVIQGEIANARDCFEDDAPALAASIGSLAARLGVAKLALGGANV